jgi:uncharacterized protein (TIGR03066 family)
MRASLALILVLCFGLVGCGSNPMVGKWKVVPDEEVAKATGPNAATFEYNFKADGTFDLVMRVRNKDVVANGNYELKGQRLFLTVTKQDGKEASAATSEVTVSSDFTWFEVPDLGKVVKQ